MTTASHPPASLQLLASGVRGAVSEYSLKPLSSEPPPAATQVMTLNISMCVGGEEARTACSVGVVGACPAHPQ